MFDIIESLTKAFCVLTVLIPLILMLWLAVIGGFIVRLVFDLKCYCWDLTITILSLCDGFAPNLSHSPFSSFFVIISFVIEFLLLGSNSTEPILIDWLFLLLTYMVSNEGSKFPLSGLNKQVLAFYTLIRSILFNLSISLPRRSLSTSLFFNYLISYVLIELICFWIWLLASLFSSTSKRHSSTYFLIFFKSTLKFLLTGVSASVRHIIIIFLCNGSTFNLDSTLFSSFISYSALFILSTSLKEFWN